MEKTFTPKQTSNYPLGTKGLVDLASLQNIEFSEKQVMEPNQRIISNILNYARALEVLKPKNNLVFYYLNN